MLGFAACVEFITDMPATSMTGVVVDIMRRTRERPLVRIDLVAADIANLREGQMHLFFRTGGMLLFGKVILTETLMAVWAAPQGFLIAFMTAPSRCLNFAMYGKLCGVIHIQKLSIVGSRENRATT
jgi:hypothetical protein